jgi:hypothetical protein
MAVQPLILLEFNELCPSLLDRFIGQGVLPNFRRLHESSTIYTTDAEEAAPNLEPWIQWPTVHFGVPYAVHQCFHLGHGRGYAGKGIAQLLSEAGIRIGVMGSMNTNYGALGGYVVPDPWDMQGIAHPEWLGTFYRTVANHVQESSRDGAGSNAQMATFGMFLIRHGLRPSTVWTILAQLPAERRDSGLKWRRAVLLDAIQYDLFRHLNRQFRPGFMTFFCNSTAHFQHYYWRNMDPERFDVPPLESDHPSLKDAILYGYRAMDRLVGKFLKDYPSEILVLCTALSQKPWIETTKCTFRPRGFADLMAFAGLDPTQIMTKPVMAEEFTVECPDENTAMLVEDALTSLTLDGQVLMKAVRTGTAVFAGCAINTPTEAGRRIARKRDGATKTFGELFYMVHSMRSGRHDPDGVLWIRNGKHVIEREKLSLTALAPMVLEHFGVPIPTSMRPYSRTFQGAETAAL